MQRNNIFKGLRYIPYNYGEWDKTKEYPPLSVVQFEGNSYTSNWFIPADVDIHNTKYWTQSANYNQQFENLRETFNNTSSEIVKKFNEFKNNILNIEGAELIC